MYEGFTLLDLPMAEICPTVSLSKYELVCEKVAEYSTSIIDRSVCSVEQVADILQNTLKTHRYTVEHFMLFMLDTRCNIIGFSDISVGSLNSAYAEPREVYRQAMMTAKCAAIIVAHNHPSGDPAPSHEDIQITNRLSEAGKILGITLYDHIIAGDGNWVSLREEGYIS